LAETLVVTEAMRVGGGRHARSERAAPRTNRDGGSGVGTPVAYCYLRSPPNPLLHHPQHQQTHIATSHSSDTRPEFVYKFLIGSYQDFPQELVAESAVVLI
jgi:hypothetical protein